MKKIRIILAILIITLIVETSNVFASTLSLSISGESIKVGQPGESIVSVASDDIAIVSVSGVLEVKNIAEATLKVEGINGWKLTYNSETGNFIAYKEEGAKSAEIIKISYTATNDVEKKIEINIKDTNITTIDYEESKNNPDINQADLDKSKIITVQAETTVKEQDGDPKIDAGAEEKPAEEKTDDDGQLLGGDDETPLIEEPTVAIKDETIAEKRIPQTGSLPTIAIAVVTLTILSIILYVKTKDMQYK